MQLSVNASLGKAMKNAHHSHHRGDVALLVSWFQIYGLQSYETTQLFGVKSEYLWHLVLASPGDSYNITLDSFL